jgi:hypothetical protein
MWQLEYDMPTDLEAEIIIKVVTEQIQIARELWYFAQLANQIFPSTGIGAYFESVEEGFILICKSLSDLQKVFSTQIPPNDFLEFQHDHPNLSLESEFFWQFEVIKPTQQEIVDKTANIIQNYWKSFNSIMTKHGDHQRIYYKLHFTSLDHYQRCQNLIIKGLKNRITSENQQKKSNP